jgi:hypothetical protein
MPPIKIHGFEAVKKNIERALNDNQSQYIKKGT